MRREYKSGSRYALWRWKDIYWNEELYLRRLILIQCPLFSIMLHWFHSEDKQRHLHNHPVSMLSIVLRGYYVEEVYDSGIRKIKWWNFIPSYKFHKVIYASLNCTTLCFAGPREQGWGFLTKHGFIPWRKYHEEHEGSTS